MTGVELECGFARMSMCCMGMGYRARFAGGVCGLMKWEVGKLHEYTPEFYIRDG